MTNSDSESSDLDDSLGFDGCGGLSLRASVVVIGDNVLKGLVVVVVDGVDVKEWFFDLDFEMVQVLLESDMFQRPKGANVSLMFKNWQPFLGESNGKFWPSVSFGLSLGFLNFDETTRLFGPTVFPKVWKFD